MQISTIGLDIAKNVFQVHGVDAAGKTVITRQLRRGQVIGYFETLPPCLVGGLRDRPSLGARADGTRSYRAVDARELRQGLRQAIQARCG